MSGDAPILDAPVRHWRCPACPAYSSTQRPDVHQEMHNCIGTSNLYIPLVEVDTRDTAPDARHVPQLGTNAKGEITITSIGTEHGSGRVDRTVIASSANPLK